jgi:PAS domain-containing protein
MLEASLGKAAFFERAEIVLTDGGQPAPESFASGQFTLPITGAEEIHGVLKVASPGRVFGPQDLHLMASLAGVLAAVLDHARKHGEAKRNLDVLNFLLNLAPVGMVALDGQGRVLAANDAARRWLGVETNGALAARLAPEVIGADWRTARAFHFQAGGRLLYAEARAHGSPATAHGLVLADVSAEQARLTDGLQRELYRGRWLAKPLVFALVESGKANAGLMTALPGLGEAMKDGETVGVLDAFHLGIVLPGMEAPAALARLRELRAHWPADGVRLGWAAGGKADAEALIAEARAALKPQDDVLRPTLLLHDDYPAVNDMIEMVLGRRYHIVKSTRIAETQELLRTRPFDGIFTEVELRNGASGIELAKFAKRLQPGIRPYFTTVSHSEKLPGLDEELGDHVVLRKPFDVARLDEMVRATLT